MATQVGTPIAILGAVGVAVGVVVNAVTMGSATTLLSVALVAAYAVWIAGRWQRDARAVLPLYLSGIALQCLHFCEEYLTGFQHEFPGLLGYQWSDQRFVAFNLIWLAVFVAAAFGVWRGVALAYLVVFFFAIGGGVGNGIGHLALSLALRRYFPGTATAPLVLLLGIVLLLTLLRSPDTSKPPPR